MPKKVNKSKKGNYLVLISILSFCLLIVVAYYSSYLFMQIYGKYNEKKELQKQLTELEDKNDELNKELEKLQDPEYIAKYAREKFYYSKDGEIIIKSK